MKAETYKSKRDEILRLPQFEKMTKGRKNALHPVRKEQNWIKEELDNLLSEGKINDSLYIKLNPIGSQPAHLHGTPKCIRKS